MSSLANTHCSITLVFGGFRMRHHISSLALCQSYLDPSLTPEIAVSRKIAPDPIMFDHSCTHVEILIIT